MSSRGVVPEALQSLSTYLQRANELKKHHPHASHQLKMLFVHVGMKLGGASKAAKVFLLQVMDEIEEEKPKLPGIDPALDIRVRTCDVVTRMHRHHATNVSAYQHNI